jgi:asparagine synthase (glutamine-hydrolysing)
VCGIAGIIAHPAENYTLEIARMISALRHRGPDDEGTDLFGNCILGHTRLSIVDLATGQQPMRDASGTCSIVFNGEIYGFQDLRRHIDYPFITTSDTEVILAMYDRWGDSLLPRLPGMFSFALWDDKEHRLICARDRFGEKPFFYATGRNGEFIFASEIKAILATGLVDPILDLAQVSHYLARLYVHPHHTIYKNIYALPPAHQLRFDRNGLSVIRYWKLPVTNKEISLQQACEEFEHLLRCSVERQMIADVPVGVFLSGGLDSSTIVAIASNFRDDLLTLSFGFEDTSELPFARDVALQYGTHHIEITEKDVDVDGLLMQMQDIYDEPFADSSNIPTFLIAQKARSYAKVMIGGDGGDELLAGYGWYREMFKLKKERKIKLLMQFLSGSLNTRKNALFRRWLFPGEAFHEFGLPLPQADEKVSRVYGLGSVDNALRMDLEDYLPGDILVKVDRASMSNGLEIRAPFLDSELASFAISLPSRLKIDEHRDKILLRESFGRFWPDSIRNRNKQGFGAPVDQWLLRPSVVKLYEDYLNNSTRKIFSLIPFDVIRPYIEERTYRTWTLLVLSLWMEGHRFSIL